MRRNAIALGYTGLLAGLAGAQVPPPAQPGQVLGSPSPFVMPGTPVGRPLVHPVGVPITPAAPAAGQRVGTGPGGIPGALDPRSPMPPGQVIDLKNVIAPYPGQPNPPKSVWDRMVEYWEELLNPPKIMVAPPNWTPGIGRRNRERAQERMWRRD
jgi:hypothetical protein